MILNIVGFWSLLPPLLINKTLVSLISPTTYSLCNILNSVGCFQIEKDGIVQIKLTPTYSGCPAMDVIGDDLKKAFLEIGKKAEIELILSPAWSTDWISEEGLQKMEEYGLPKTTLANPARDFTLEPLTRGEFSFALYQLLEILIPLADYLDEYPSKIIYE